MSDAAVEITLENGIEVVGQESWDACACPEASDGARPVDPFTTFRFLSALERSGSVGEGTGWQSRPLVARIGGQVIAVAPLYLKSHSQGEYIFDFAWANAYEQAGGRYYPKLQVAVPFTPTTGRRLLTAPDFGDVGQRALLSGLAQVCGNNGISSAHVTFCTESEAAFGEQLGYLHRYSQQFHWQNCGYAGFDEFLGHLTSRKRKTIRRERREAGAFGGDIVQLTGDDLRAEHWDAFWRFYQDTGARKWGSPYLTRAFFDEVQATMRDDVLLVLAVKDGDYVAGALNFIGQDTLFGRYWGALEYHPCLHFELCYYQAIDFAIANGLSRVEAGAQGDHKVARGYVPVKTHSLHWIADAGFRSAVDRFVREEAAAVADENAYLADFGPFRKTDGT